MQNNSDNHGESQKDKLQESISRRALLKMGFSSAMVTMLLASAKVMTVASVAVGISGCGTSHDSTTGTVSDSGTALGAPTDVVATAGNGRVTMAWTAVPGAISYNIYWSTTPGVTTTTGTKITGVTNPYTTSGLVNGTPYYCIVTAVNSQGESSASTQVSATPSSIAAGTAPSAPTGVIATAGNGQVTMAWAVVPGATSYNIYWSTTPGVTTTTGTKITGVTNPYTTTGLINGTPYYCIVTAVNSQGESSASTQVSATPSSIAAGTAPSAPTGVIATAGNGQVTMAWAAVPGATSYNIYWSTTPGVTTTNGTKITGVTNPYTTSGLINGTPYYCIVTAVNSQGESSASTQVSATPVGSTYSNYSNYSNSYSNYYHAYNNYSNYYSNYFVNSW